MAVISQVRLWRNGRDYITFDYASAQPRYLPQGERICDRLGFMHRIAPDCARFPTGLSLELIPEELTRLNNVGASPVQAAIAWLEQAFRQQELLCVFVLGQTVSEGDTAISRKLAFQGYIDELPSAGFGTLPIAGTGSDTLELSLLVIADGVFTDFENLEGAEYSPRE
jgi:hypothetical protein